jgi:hypothetical protein
MPTFAKRGLDLLFENSRKVQRLLPFVAIVHGKTKSPGLLYSFCDFHSNRRFRFRRLQMSACAQ